MHYPRRRRLGQIETMPAYEDIKNVWAAKTFFELAVAVRNATHPALGGPLERGPVSFAVGFQWFPEFVDLFNPPSIVFRFGPANSGQLYETALKDFETKLKVDPKSFTARIMLPVSGSERSLFEEPFQEAVRHQADVLMIAVPVPAVMAPAPVPAPFTFPTSLVAGGAAPALPTPEVALALPAPAPVVYAAPAPVVYAAPALVRAAPALVRAAPALPTPEVALALPAPTPAVAAITPTVMQAGIFPLLPTLPAWLAAGFGSPWVWAAVGALALTLWAAVPAQARGRGRR